MGALIYSTLVALGVVLLPIVAVSLYRAVRRSLDRRREE
jgi:hypothetical protein